MILDVKNKKILTIVFSLLIVFILGFILIQNAFFKPTKLNYFIASKIYKTPANTAFTDENFYKCVVDAYNRKNNTSLPYTTNLSDEQLNTINELVCMNNNKSDEEKIKSVNGLERLISLKRLDVSSNQLTNMNISKNTSLTWLDVGENQLTNLDVSKNTALEIFSANNNQLTDIDISKNIALENLDVSSNQLTGVDISKNTVLKSSNVRSNKLTELDLNNNTALENLDANKNQLTSLDVSNNPKLTSLNISFNKLENLNLSNTSKLKQLLGAWNNLSYVDLTNSPNLVWISLYENKLEEIDISNCKNLKILDLGLDNVNNSNNLTSIDVSKNINLEVLKLGGNKISNIDLKNNINLTRLEIACNNITNIDLSNNINLNWLIIDNNYLKELDVSNNLLLTNLEVDRNQLTKLDISKNTDLIHLSAGNNKITQLDTKNNIGLRTLDVEENQLTNLDLKTNENLIRLRAYSNNFSKILTVYKNEMFDYPDFSEILFPQDKNVNLLNIKQDNNIVEIIDTSSSGFYQYELNYAHNIQNYSNTIEVVLNLYIIEATSDKYEINAEEGYIYTKTDTDENTILSNINLSYGDASIEDNKLLIKYNEKLIKSFDIVNVSSDVYKITDNYLYYENGNMKSSNIKLTNATYTEIDDSQHNKKMSIKYNGKEIDQLDFVTYYSNKYDLTKDYIFSEEELNLDLINTTNLIKEIKDNKLIIRYNDEIFKNIDIVKVESNKYDLGKNYIYTGTSNLDLNDINVINGQKIIEDDKLKIKYNEDLLKEYSIYSINFEDYKEYDRLLILPEDITYEELTNNITTNGVTYKLFSGETEITKGNISKGMIIKIYYGDEAIDKYEVTNEYLEFDESLNIDNETNIIEKLPRNLKLKDFISLINTSGSIEIRNNNELLSDKSVIGTGSKLKITLSKGTVEYTLSVIGDVTGNGQAKMADVMKIATHIIEGNVIEGETFERAADITGDGKIKMNDVMKLATFIIDGGEL